MGLVAPLASASVVSAVGAALPPRRAMRALDCVVIAALVHKSAVDALIALQKVLSCAKACRLIERYSGVRCCLNALFATRHHVRTSLTTFRSHVVAIVAHAGTRHLVCVLVLASLSADAQPVLYGQVLTGTLSALIVRAALDTA